MRVDERRALIATIKSIETITFSKHAEEMIETEERLINKEMLKQFLRLSDTEKLTYILDQGVEELGHKYKLLFYKSNVYDVVIVISIKADNSALNIVTAYTQNRAKRRRLDLWLEKHQ